VTEISLTDEQLMLQDTIRTVLAKELAPIVDEYETKAKFPSQILPTLGALGLLGLGFPAEVGGAGGYVEVAVLAEELAAVAGGVCSGVMTHCIGSKIIASFGSVEQRARYLQTALVGQLVTAIAITEPDHGSDVGGLETTATRTENGWRLRGQKMFITNASHADVFMVMATTDRGKGKAGITMFLVERDTPRVNVGEPLKKLGWHSSDTCPVYLDDCEVPADALLGTPGRGFEQLTEGFVFERVIMAAMGVGAGRAALDDAITYAKERRQFGRRIADFQVIKHQLADLAVQLVAARLLTHHAAMAADVNPRNEVPAAMAKLFATEVASRIAERAVQIHGGMGFMDEVRVSRIYRDVKVLTIGGGTSEIMRSIVSRSLGL
jgi:alkylation response protein AidB-like acyl-CoA dehydrogenase